MIWTHWGFQHTDLCIHRLSPCACMPFLKSYLLDAVVVSWCFEPSQPVGIISGLKTSMAQFLHTHTHTHTHAHTHTHTHTQTHTHAHTHTHTYTHTIFLHNHIISTTKLKYFCTQNLLEYTSYSIEHTSLFQGVKISLWIYISGQWI